MDIRKKENEGEELKACFSRDFCFQFSGFTDPGKKGEENTEEILHDLYFTDGDKLKDQSGKE